MWLKNHNILYKDIVINFDLTDTWEGKFIPAGISSRVLQYDDDIQEKEGYAANLETDNFENNLHYAVNSAGISDSSVLSGCLYTDTDDTQEYLTMKLVSAICNHKRKSNNQDVNTLILTYKNPGRVISLNDWDNPEYFTASLPSLFAFGTGDHISTTNSSRKYKIPLES